MYSFSVVLYEGDPLPIRNAVCVVLLPDLIIGTLPSSIDEISCTAVSPRPVLVTPIPLLSSVFTVPNIVEISNVSLLFKIIEFTAVGESCKLDANSEPSFILSAIKSLNPFKEIAYIVELSIPRSCNVPALIVESLSISSNVLNLPPRSNSKTSEILPSCSTTSLKIFFTASEKDSNSKSAKVSILSGSVNTIPNRARFSIISLEELPT